MIFGVWNHEKIWYRYSLYICPHYLYTAANSPWEIQKKSFFNSIIHTYFRLFALSKKKTLQLLCCSLSVYLLLFTASYYLRSPMQGSYGQGKSGNFEESEKTERVRKKSGNFKIPLTRPIIYAYFRNFCRLLGASPPDLHRGGAPPL